jgi:hypothetical protein
LDDFNELQMEGFARASLAFLDSYLQATKGRSAPHSYALTRMLSSFESSLSSTYRINGADDFSRTSAYGHLSVTADFVKKSMALINKYAVTPKSFRRLKNRDNNIYDDMAALVFNMIFAASTVSSPVWTAWSIQHNTVWNTISGLGRDDARRIIAFKVRRLLYEEIARMGTFANFKGARILGYCLNVLGLTLNDRHKGYDKEFYPLRAAVLHWTKANYGRLVSDHPKVAETCLQGSISYDASKRQLVNTFGGELGKEPNRVRLDID